MYVLKSFRIMVSFCKCRLCILKIFNALFWVPAALFCELENDVDWEGPLKIMWSLPESKYQPDELQKEKHTGYHTVSVLFCDSLQTQGDDKLKKTLPTGIGISALNMLSQLPLVLYQIFFIPIVSKLCSSHSVFFPQSLLDTVCSGSLRIRSVSN